MTIFESLFGKSKRPFWDEFAKQQNGTLKSESGDLFVEYKYSNFIFKVKNYNYTNAGGGFSDSYMVGMAEFDHPTQLELQISKEDWFASIVKFFKNKEIKIGNNDFDKRFFITSNKELKTITILKDKSLLEKIILFNPIRIEITNKEDFGEVPSKGKYMLYCVKQEKFKDLAQLNEIHSVLVSFIENLKENCQIQ
ncbi:hypothetical protein [Flavobacterium sp. XGLA_31]|uniref:hypothetical protein n=1 Tax=Flavobacterium sp. XGLA_31 TaxID=3447666 RepID=UPI003F321E6E